MKGKFIVIEGLEGAGKSTAISVVVDELNKQSINDIQFTREPGGTPLAEKLRTLVKENDDNEPLTEKAELLLLYAARVQLVDNVIKPALAKGQWVIGDRHDLSSQAYQGGGRQLDPRLMKTLRDAILGDFYPDLTIYLDISPELGLKRASQRGKLDRFEQEPIEFFNRIRNSYLELVKGKPNIVTIDAAQSIENVSQDITIALQNWLSKQK